MIKQFGCFVIFIMNIKSTNIGTIGKRVWEITGSGVGVVKNNIKQGNKMVRKFTNPQSNRKVLIGNDTDVSDIIITKCGDNKFVLFGINVNEESGDVFPDKPIVLSKEGFTEHFELQYGSPMHYISKEDFEWIIN